MCGSLNAAIKSSARFLHACRERVQRRRCPPAMSSDAPRYVQIFNTLSRRMETGTYSVDTRLPTESELCDEFNASRFTVREALRRLVEQGMVQRQQGAGSNDNSAQPPARNVH